MDEKTVCEVPGHGKEAHGGRSQDCQAGHHPGLATTSGEGEVGLLGELDIEGATDGHHVLRTARADVSPTDRAGSLLAQRAL